MDLRTGKTYDTREAAEADGVPASDIAEFTQNDTSMPEVRFASGPFKSRTYRRTHSGQLIRVDALRKGLVEKYDGQGNVIRVRE